MSLVGTLGKLAVGVLVAKGVGGLLKGKAGKRGGATPVGNSTDSGMGGLLGGSAGAAGSGAGTSGDLGGLLERLGGVTTNVPQQTPGSHGGAQMPGQGSTVSRLDDLLNPASKHDSASEEDQAALLIRAMINAARCDGEIDDDEKRQITSQLGDISDADRAFVQRELSSAPDLNAFIDSVPPAMAHQVYTMSLMAINLDSRAEADYLDRLATGLHISHEDCNRIHQQLGVPTLFT